MKRQKVKLSEHVKTREAAVAFANTIVAGFLVGDEMAIAIAECSAMYHLSKRHFGVVCSLSPYGEITLIGRKGVPRVEFVPCTWESLRDQGADKKTIDAFQSNDWEQNFPVIVACPYGYEKNSFSIAWIVHMQDSGPVMDKAIDEMGSKPLPAGKQTRPICVCGKKQCPDKHRNPFKQAEKQKDKTPVTFRRVSHEMYGGRKCDQNGCDERVKAYCTKCKLVAYCSVACQKEHWVNGGHQYVCGVPLTPPSGSTGADKADKPSGSTGHHGQENSVPRACPSNHQQ
jgi:hypothetical protein